MPNRQEYDGSRHPGPAYGLGHLDAFCHDVQRTQLPWTAPIKPFTHHPQGLLDQSEARQRVRGSGQIGRLAEHPQDLRHFLLREADLDLGHVPRLRRHHTPDVGWAGQR